MGIFRDSRHRLLRTKWTTADLLAEELYALFGQDNLEIDGPVTIENDTLDPAITIIAHDFEDDASIAFKRPGSTDETLGKPKGTDADGDPVDESPTIGAGGGIPAKIISGSGSTYTIDLYQNGTGEAASDRVTATQLQILSTETIPADTWTLATKIAGSYYFQVAVWL